METWVGRLCCSRAFGSDHDGGDGSLADVGACGGCGATSQLPRTPAPTLPHGARPARERARQGVGCDGYGPGRRRDRGSESPQGERNEWSTYSLMAKPGGRAVTDMAVALAELVVNAPPRATSSGCRSHS